MHSQYSSKAGWCSPGAGMRSAYCWAIDPHGLAARVGHAGAMSAIEQSFRQRTPASAEHAAAARRVMPGGDTRAAGHHPPYQLTIVKAPAPG